MDYFLIFFGDTMKKCNSTILLCFILLFSTLSINAFPGIRILINKGVPGVYGGCYGIAGICSIQILNASANPTLETGQVLLDGTADVIDNRLNITITSEFPAELKNGKSRSSFRIRCTTTLDESLANSLGYENLSVVKGTYSFGGNTHTRTSIKVTGTQMPQYPEVVIGTQTWLQKNLEVTTYRNGDPIPEITDIAEWANTTSGAWCYYNNDPANGPIYGKLYNWYAVNDPRGLAPEGWHIASDYDLKILEVYLGMSWSNADNDGIRGTDEGGKMKEAGNYHWLDPNTGANNLSGFTALPGGLRTNGYFTQMGQYGYFWTATIYPYRGMPWYRLLANDGSFVYRNIYTMNEGMSVRCVKD